jgi:CRP/FNR family transcriptional regulator, cyclic AMP receptor protein
MSASAETVKSFLTRTPFFGGLDDRALERIITMLVERAFAPGDLVFREGESGHSMYIVESGKIVLCATGASGLQVRLVRLGPGDFFGDTTLIEMQPRPYTARVEQAAKLFELTNMDLYRLYREDVKAYVLVLQNVNRELCRRLRKADTRITRTADEAGDERTQITEIPPFLRR